MNHILCAFNATLDTFLPVVIGTSLAIGVCLVALRLGWKLKYVAMASILLSVVIVFARHYTECAK